MTDTARLCTIAPITGAFLFEGCDVPERVTDLTIALLYALATISGGLGGCTVAAHHVLRGKTMRLSFALAYLIIGAVFGLLSAAYGIVVVHKHITEVIGPCIIAGMAGAIALGMSNLSARFILKRLGIEVVVSVKRKDEDQQP